ncbi:6-phosphogluconate dehydrogenase C-terminal domain-like protein [Durotheca rogersii]|uniref:6-phosphogluconate dehydrogenase C-terminal domain-like protein n=1 Tax=Durotheca rogersii TaxID=419775 RepID=UPI002220C205|nr:6-phosphogluconate dehydrogenase C-terminal domain-like protein [Durotheca rogersii]KAI5863051.1 6-phosphogluconate dehydrogenase C-terminal domain-like protein [Durotheca rogersii]
MYFIRRIGANIMTCRPRHPLRAASSAENAPAEWLRRLLEGRTKPPKLYAWTPENLPVRIRSAEQSLPTESQSQRPGGDDERRRIYVLGIGNLGRLYASFLAKSAERAPITLVVHRRELLESWADHPGIELVRDGKAERNAEFDIEWWTEAAPPRGPVREPGRSRGSICNLIVATKAADTLPQVDRLRRYLGAGSTVAFTQNGVCKLWPPLGATYVAARWPSGTGPSWLACVTTHGVTSLGPFRSVHASPAGVLVGVVTPVSSDRGHGSNSTGTGSKVSAYSGGEYLIEQLVNAPGLAAQRLPTRELWVSQLEKLVVNSVINPLTAVLRCRNGEIFADRGDRLPAVIDELLAEASRVLRALAEHSSTDAVLAAEAGEGGGGSDQDLREFRGALAQRFAPARLRAMLDGVAAKVGANTSSMLQDVRAGRTTEVADLNGWLVDAARYVGAEAGGGGLPAHEKLVALVSDGAKMTREELVQHVLGR